MNLKSLSVQSIKSETSNANVKVSSSGMTVKSGVRAGAIRYM